MSRLTIEVMAHVKLISPDDIIETAVRIIEAANADRLSLRSIAASLGVKAPSLYRYFPHKEALELAVAEQSLTTMLARLRKAASAKSPEARFRATVDAYLRFAREHFALYSFIMDRVPQMHGSAIAKDVWNLLLEAASDISEQPDDTSAAVAVWSFLHGYAILEHSGAFGASGPKGGLELGLTAFLNSFRRSAVPARKRQATQSTDVRRSSR